MPVAHILLLQSLLVASFTAPAGGLDSRVHADGDFGARTSLSVGAIAGGHVFADGTKLGVAGGTQNPNGAKSGVLGGLRASLGLGSWFVAEAEIVGVATEDRMDGRKARVLGYRVNGLAPLMAGRFRPFVSIGAGAMQVVSSEADGSSGLARGTTAEVHTGIGFDYRLGGMLSLRADARVLQMPSKATWGLTSDVEAMVSASVTLGGARAEAPSQLADGRAVVARTISDLLERGREIRFEAGTAKVAESSLPFLQDLATALAQERAARLEIVVHTADSGDAKKDMTLSKRRAEAVKDVLVLKGANPDQLLPTGRGCEDPVAPNLTRTGRFRNERVELHRVSSPSRGS